MSKVLLFFILLFFNFLPVFSNSNEIKIIKRSEWGANESFRYRDSTYWVDILNSWKNFSQKPLTKKERENRQRRKKKVNLINSYLINVFPENNSLVQLIKNEKGHPLAWNIEKTKYVRAIVVHHTYSEYDNSKEGIKAIYKYHALNRAWGDIGYNYVIGYNGEIYEGRAGGDYTVGAHAIWNNRSTVSISVMGNYQKKPITDSQYKSLDKLIKYLTKKYGIDLSKTYDYHRECHLDKCKIGVNTYKDFTLIGHRDAGITSCPGDELEKQIELLRKSNISYTKGFKPIANKNSEIINKTIKAGKKTIDKLRVLIDKLPERKKLLLLVKIEEKLDNLTFDDGKYYLYYKIKEIILSDFKLKNHFASKKDSVKSFDKTNRIRVKLSYPHNDHIDVLVGDKEYKIKKEGDYLLLNGEKKKIVYIKSKKGGFSEIKSWTRIPAWDQEKKYNDNKFRGNLVLYVKNGKLNVVNVLYLRDYLKGLGEVSNYENASKIETIIISARTYARWYMTKARKFPKEFYQASDDPDIFQKYLGYGLELRSPRINKIIDETTDRVISYNGEIIKPWYFSSSNGYTISFNKFCEYSLGIPDCLTPNNFPFLFSVKDPGGIGKQRLGHGVGISGTGVKYFAERGWTYEMIIKYFLKGVEIIDI
ncbi:hypothetical protein CSA08_03105 [Candidatus Gracilibacteria bacterium]|nr:MAG: hypothetical protein CSA08_03105 [Candidatus Gracilibacteria bacterium]